MDENSPCCVQIHVGIFKIPLEVKVSWIDSKFQGLFASKTIKAGEKVCEYRGRQLNTLEAFRTTDKSYLMRLSSQCYIDAKDSGYCLARYINDCRNPAGYNVYFDKRPEENCAYVKALRDIMVGEELFADYGRWYWLSLNPIRLSFGALQTLKKLIRVPSIESFVEEEDSELFCQDAD